MHFIEDNVSIIYIRMFSIKNLRGVKPLKFTSCIFLRRLNDTFCIHLEINAITYNNNWILYTNLIIWLSESLSIL